MNEFLENTFLAIQTAAMNASIHDLKNPKFADTLTKELTTNKIILDQLNASKPTIDKEMMVPGQVPSGLHFTPGEDMEYVLFKIPIIGNATVLKKRARNLLDNIEMKIEKKELIIKVYSQLSIVGNNSVINQIKESANQKIRTIQKIIDATNKEITECNEQFPKFVPQIIDAELKRRDNLDDTLNKLKLFP